MPKIVKCEDLLLFFTWVNVISLDFKRQNVQAEDFLGFGAIYDILKTKCLIDLIEKIINKLIY